MNETMAYRAYHHDMAADAQRHSGSVAQSGRGRRPLASHGHPRSPARASLGKVGKFLVVGGIGVLVNSLTLLLLVQWAHTPLVVASVLATMLAIISNFTLNNRWTFRGTSPRNGTIGRFAQFNLVALGGLIINTCVLWICVRRGGIPYLAANLIGIALATTWNYMANSLWTWGGAL